MPTSARTGQISWVLSGIPASRVPAIPATAMAAHSHQARISIRYSQAAEPSSAGISAAALDSAAAGRTVG